MKSRNKVRNGEAASTSTPKLDPLESKSKSEPSSAEIRQRAFEIYNERGGSDGADLEDWLQAERELQEEYRQMKQARKN